MMVNVNKNSGSPTLNGNDLGAQVENGPSPAPSLRDLEVGGGRLVKEEIDESQEHDVSWFFEEREVSVAR